MRRQVILDGDDLVNVVHSYLVREGTIAPYDEIRLWVGIDPEIQVTVEYENDDEEKK